MRAQLGIGVAGLIAAGCVGGISGIGDENLAPPNADPQAGCAIGCHGGELSNAPPTSLSGATETTAVGIGAHQAHLDPASTWHRPIACADCHRVPEEVSSPGHVDDGDRTAELTFGMIAGPGAAWNGTTCTTACHGSAAYGGTAPTPQWTRVDGTQATCGSCHGTPPPAPHPTDTNCAACHPTMEEGALAFRDPASHINGVVDVVGSDATGGCTSCHGSPASSAPPRDLSGDTARTASGVGAHQQHLGPSTWHREIACASCHVVPTTADAPGHRDGDNVAEVIFDPLNPAGVYTAATTTCASQYCHGNGRGNTGTISWLAQGPLPCTGCHSTNGSGQSGEHRKHVGEENMACADCHLDVVNAQLAIIAPALHVNGVHEVRMPTGTWNPANRTCSNTGCHGTETW
jgi:predicted CxxxxCH...CXXCH cytochrome family protein